MADVGQQRILIVDGDAAMRVQLIDALAHLGEIKEAHDGQQALALAQEFRPHIVLLDTDLAVIDGFELCRQLVQSVKETRVVFMASNASLESREAAYLAGADDYMGKPLLMPKVRYRIERLAKVIADAEQLKQSLKSATDVAMMAISNSGEMGGVIDFMKRTSECHDIEALLKAVVSTCAGHFQLKVSAQISTEHEQKTLNSEGRSSPLEAELLLRLREGQRIYQYGTRMVINYPNAIVQIKDLNWSNDEYIGRIRDHIAIVVEAASNRVNGIVLEQAMIEHNRKIQSSINQIVEVVRQVEVEYKYQQGAARELFEGLRIQISGALAGLGLTDAQEEDLLYIVQASSMYADKLYEAGFSLDQKFAGVIGQLQQLIVAETQLVSVPESDLDDSVILF
ncbi:response regulator [Chitinibacter sp. SCUT-21]|uniref:response regulator n=1 Tax=Chitinibacter sp. SCUT-21 TaxID=2970891 RepID=UPI0035A5FE41